MHSDRSALTEDGCSLCGPSCAGLDGLDGRRWADACGLYTGREGVPALDILSWLASTSFFNVHHLQLMLRQCCVSCPSNVKKISADISASFSVVRDNGTADTDGMPKGKDAQASGELR